MDIIHVYPKFKLHHILKPWTGGNHKLGSKSVCTPVKSLASGEVTVPSGMVLKVVTKVVCCDPLPWEALASAPLRGRELGKGSSAISSIVVLSGAKGAFLPYLQVMPESRGCREPHRSKTRSGSQSLFLVNWGLRKPRTASVGLPTAPGCWNYLQVRKKCPSPGSSMSLLLQPHPCKYLNDSLLPSRTLETISIFCGQLWNNLPGTIILGSN